MAGRARFFSVFAWLSFKELCNIGMAGPAQTFKIIRIRHRVKRLMRVLVTVQARIDLGIGAMESCLVTLRAFRHDLSIIFLKRIVGVELLMAV